ncbi:MAG: ABC transporter ATP-binding protein [Acidobacteria bacterium]|nr:ABC transporter ATP-binding protein [Acidobacteriota bacterium]
MAKETLIEARGLKRYYRRGSEVVKAVDGIDLDIRSGEMVSVMGPSGSGKTTLIHLLSCLDAPTGGTLTIMGRAVGGLAEDELTKVRRGVLGFVFQNFYLLPTLNVAENVELPLLFYRQPVKRDETLEVLRRVSLEDRARHMPNQLSGGQMQRVAIARALIIRPKILIADEPTGNLDSENGEAVFELFRSLVRDRGITVLVTTHNTPLGRLADRIITLKDGRIDGDSHRDSRNSPG